MKKDDKKDDERRNKLIGANIQKYRKSIGMTQEGLAESLGLSAGHMTALENGYTGISLPKFIEVSKILNVSTDSLLTDGNSGESLDHEITQLLKNCDEGELKLMLAVLRAIKNNS